MMGGDMQPMMRMMQMMQERMNAVKAIGAPARALYTALSPDQQKKADALTGHGMGGM
jgi:LTXXQ motif family protein